MRIAGAVFVCLTLFIDNSRGAEQPPHIVVFISDDHGYWDSEVAGNRDVRTPNMRRLADAGMTLTHAFAASPSCAPSRAALLTGLMPNRNGSMLNHQRPREDVKKLPAYLHELGYEVVAFGKVAHYQQAKLYGFDHAAYDTFHDHQCIPAALKYLRERESSKPLCLMVGTNWPHVPWPEIAVGGLSEADDGRDRQGKSASETPPTSEDLAKMALPPTHVDTPQTRRWRARYYAAVEKMDADLGQVYESAYEWLGENTLFIHFSDHGAQWPFGKWNVYDAGIRVPFFAVWPEEIDPKSQSHAMISLVDVLPTLIDAAGGEPPAGVDGRSRLSNLRDAEAPGSEFILTTHSGDGRMNEYPMRSVRGRDWKYIFNLRPDDEHHTHIDRGQAVDGNGYWHSWVEKAKTDEQAKSIVDRYYRRPAEEFYDLVSDPFETHSVIAEATNQRLVDEARTALKRFAATQGDEGLVSEEAAATSFRARQRNQ